MGLMDWMWQSEIVSEERARLERYEKAWQAYFGEHPDPLKVLPGKPNDNVIVNYARTVVDKGVAFLFGREPVFELDEGMERSPAEVYLDEVWRANRKMQLLQKLAVNGGVCGHAFVKVTLPRAGEVYPRLVLLSPEYVSVVCDPNDVDLVWRYVIQYAARGKDGARLVIRQVVERDEAGRWTIVDQVSRNDGAFVDVQPPALWPWPWSPVVDCQNLPSPNEYYGLADIERDVLKLNAAINFGMSNLQRILRYHAHPKTWVRGAAAKEVDISVENIIGIPNPQGELRNLEMLSDLSSSIEYVRRLREALHETAGIPEVATGRLESAGNLSGVALQILYQPILERTEAKRLTYGEMLIELNRRLLEMGGYGAGHVCAIHWPELLPSNRLEQLQAAVLAEQVGVSQDTLLTELGYDPAAEAEKRQQGATTLADTLLGAFDAGDEGEEVG
jgi:hypothetical protein